jgi:hypothetical protein
MFSAQLEKMIDRVIGTIGAGASVTLRRQNRLIEFDSNQPASSVALNGGFGVGAASLSLHLASGVLAGNLIAGTTLTVSGDVTVYTVTADAQAASGAVAAAISPALQFAALSGAVVTLSSYADYLFPHAQFVRIGDRDVDGVKLGSHDLMVALPSLNAPTAPIKGDLVQSDDGSLGVVHQVWPLRPAGVDCGWRVLIGKPAVGAFR